MKNLFYELKDLARTACQFGLRHGPVSGNTVGERLMLLQYFVSGGTVQIRFFLRVPIGIRGWAKSLQSPYRFILVHWEDGSENIHSILKEKDQEMRKAQDSFLA